MLLPEQRTRLHDLAADATTHVATLDHDTSDLTAFVVGGAVRDALFGTASNDYDFVVVDETPSSMRDRGFHPIDASSFPVFHDDDHEEWALARTETKTGYGYKGFDIATDDVSLTDDLRRRDLRMNAIAVQVSGDAYTPADDAGLTILDDADPVVRVIDPFDGIRDIHTGVIRHVSDAFTEDPIRVLRAARYASRFTTLDHDAPLTIHPDTVTMMQQVAPELNRMSRDRIGTEIVKAMLQATDPPRFWRVLRTVGALAVLAPTLDRASIVPAGAAQFHGEDNTFDHTMLVLDRMHTLCERHDITGIDRVRRYLMAIAHDLGKVTIADKKGGLWSDDPPTRFGNHDTIGVDDARQLGRRVGLDEHYVEVMEDAALLHMDVFDLPNWDEADIIDFVDNRTPAANAQTPTFATIDELVDLLQSDHEGRFQATDEIDGAYRDDDQAPDGHARPVLNRDMYDSIIEYARHAIDAVDGYDVLRDGLCTDHDPDQIHDDDIASVLASCPHCRTPGAWVGEEITDRRQTILATKT